MLCPQNICFLYKDFQVFTKVHIKSLSIQIYNYKHYILSFTGSETKGLVPWNFWLY